MALESAVTGLTLHSIFPAFYNRRAYYHDQAWSVGGREQSIPELAASLLHCIAYPVRRMRRMLELHPP